jgi:hypothetical protein
MYSLSQPGSERKGSSETAREAASDGAGNTAERLTGHPLTEDDMATKDHTGARGALEQLIKEQRANLISAHAVQQCLYQVLLYADDEDAVIHAEAAHVVAAMMNDIVEKLDSLKVDACAKAPAVTEVDHPS